MLNLRLFPKLLSMEKAYKYIIAVSGALAAISVALVGEAWLSDNIANTLFAYLGGGLLFMLVFSLVIGGAYTVIKWKKSPYLGILLFSIALTAFLFFMDYTVWDVQPEAAPASRILFESLVVGGFYVGIFFAAFSGIYAIFDTLFKWCGRLTSLKK
jgi:hypothetical protein